MTLASEKSKLVSFAVMFDAYLFSVFINVEFNSSVFSGHVYFSYLFLFVSAISPLFYLYIINVLVY